MAETVRDVFAKLSDPQRGVARLLWLHYWLVQNVAAARKERGVDTFPDGRETVTFDSATLDLFLNELWAWVVCVGREVPMDDNFATAIAIVDSSGAIPAADPRLFN